MKRLVNNSFIGCNEYYIFLNSDMVFTVEDKDNIIFTGYYSDCVKFLDNIYLNYLEERY